MGEHSSLTRQHSTRPELGQHRVPLALGPEDVFHGLTCRAAGDAPGARSQFRLAADAAREEGWEEVAALAGVEIARSHADEDDAAAAETALRATCALFEAGSSPIAAARFRRAFGVHFPDASEVRA